MKADDLEQIAELGRGAYGVVDKMRHVPSGLIMAVKVSEWPCALRSASAPVNAGCLLHQRIRATVNTQEQKRLLMDLDISMRTVDCFYTVTFYGALFREVTVNRSEVVVRLRNKSPYDPDSLNGNTAEVKRALILRV